MLRRFQGFLEQATKGANQTFARFTKRDELDRLVIACGLVAYADGNCDDDEKAATRGLIKQNMPHWEINDIAESWQSFENLMNLGNLKFAKLEGIAKLKLAVGEEKGALCRGMILIAGADGKIDEDEKTMMSDIMAALGERPADYGL